MQNNIFVLYIITDKIKDTIYLSVYLYIYIYIQVLKLYEYKIKLILKKKVGLAVKKLRLTIIIH